MKDDAQPNLPADPNIGDGALLEGELETPAPFETLDEVDSGFSMLDIEDRVVISLLFNELIRTEHVEAAWKRARQHAEKGDHDSSQQQGVRDSADSQ